MALDENTVTFFIQIINKLPREKEILININETFISKAKEKSKKNKDAYDPNQKVLT